MINDKKIKRNKWKKKTDTNKAGRKMRRKIWWISKRTTTNTANKSHKILFPDNIYYQRLTNKINQF